MTAARKESSETRTEATAADGRAAADGGGMKKTSVIRFGPLYYARRYLPNVLRLSAFFAFLYVVALLLAAHEARAQVSEMFMGMGIEMLRYDEAIRQEAPRTLNLNGTPIRLASGLTTHPLERVLDWYEVRCKDRGGQLAEQIEEITRGDPDIGEVDGSLFDATLREQDGSKGFVACLDTGGGTLETSDIAASLQRFRSTLDLTEFGDLRYIYAEESGGTTLFVTFWTEGSLEVLTMFPPTGDAPGRDVEGVARPPRARRILSAWEEGEPQSVTIYAGSPLDPDGLEAFYRRSMRDAGWHLLELPEAIRERVPAARRAEHFLVFERGDEMVSMGFGTAEDGLGTATVLSH